ncbi:uncharacterized protein METZ01_LOCUS381965, partial [marine metagenome]
MANKIWQKSKIIKSSDPESYQLAKSYFTEHRKISTEHYSDLLKKGLIRFNKYKDDIMLVYPSLSTETAILALENKHFNVYRIQKIFLNPDGSKHHKGKRHLGSNGNESAAFVIPPLNEQVESKHAAVCEGLEDALS